mgnify:CR=1 FL=1
MKIETIALPIVRLALAEDLGGGDVTTRALVSETARARGVIEARAGGVLAGLEVARLAFRELDRDMVFRMRFQDGAVGSPRTSCFSAARIATIDTFSIVSGYTAIL